MVLGSVFNEMLFVFVKLVFLDIEVLLVVVVDDVFWELFDVIVLFIVVVWICLFVLIDFVGILFCFVWVVVLFVFFGVVCGGMVCGGMVFDFGVVWVVFLGFLSVCCCWENMLVNCLDLVLVCVELGESVIGLFGKVVICEFCVVSCCIIIVFLLFN